MAKEGLPTARLAGGLFHISGGEVLRSVLAVFAAIAAVSSVSGVFLSGTGVPLIVASMGASAVLVFGVSHSPLAQPWPVFGSHLVSSAIGVACAQTVPSPSLAAALTVALALLAMLVLRCLHPPGGATALIPVLAGSSVRDLGFGFVLAPVGLNAALMVTLGVLVNRWVLRRPYPAPAVPTHDERHRHADPRPLDRLGLRREDLLDALERLDTFVDVTESDLDQIYRLASLHAARRQLGEVRCRDIMSRDVRAVGPQTDIEEAWALLRYHKVAMLPVLDGERRVIGTLSVVDILKRADLKAYEGIGERLSRLVGRRPALGDERLRAVADFMATGTVTASEDTHIADLVPLLSDQGLHHIPIVDPQGRLVGVVTQSDLIAALFAGYALERAAQGSAATGQTAPP